MTRPNKKRRWWEWLDFPEELALGLLLVSLAGWLVAELIAPLLAGAAYVVIVLGLRTVANDRHGCEGRLGRAALWGALWATVFTGPVALLIWGAHWLLAAHG